MASFTSEVIAQLNYYVYMLIDPRNGRPFYVGKGKGNRIFDHVEGMPSKASESDSEKIQRIIEISHRGQRPIHVIHRHGMTEEEAEEVEAALIDYLWDQLSNEIRGLGSNDYGPASVEELQTRYGAEEWERHEDHKLLVIKVRYETVIALGGIYEATKAAWRVNLDNASNTDYVLSVVNGMCRAVFENCDWYRYSETRCAFNGEEVSEGSPVYERYVNKRIPKNLIRRGMAIPTLYLP